MQQPQNMMHHQPPQQQQPPPEKRKQAGGAGVPVPHMQPGMPGVNSPMAQGMHPAMAQQMVMKKIPEPEDPTIADMPPPPNPYEYLHAKALEDQVVQLERQADDTMKQGQNRLEDTRARFAAIEQEASDQHASMQLDP
ncbi:hypothetical protein QFC20_006585 [Naganishia adeliensis]|uniref:Uncharacterized protein n=1 Tax=Naganishia adeliensis TaxID=92952 RepID=A0ACC2VA36_9TREE|nr:hypothetical protein QFC20_006585 [Naganishia adeliensis]